VRRFKVSTFAGPLDRCLARFVVFIGSRSGTQGGPFDSKRGLVALRRRGGVPAFSGAKSRSDSQRDDNVTVTKCRVLRYVLTELYPKRPSTVHEASSPQSSGQGGLEAAAGPRAEDCRAKTGSALEKSSIELVLILIRPLTTTNSDRSTIRRDRKSRKINR
jgi:hypothetical protein